MDKGKHRRSFLFKENELKISFIWQVHLFHIFFQTIFIEINFIWTALSLTELQSALLLNNRGKKMKLWKVYERKNIVCYDVSSVWNFKVEPGTKTWPHMGAHLHTNAHTVSKPKGVCG